MNLLICDLKAAFNLEIRIHEQLAMHQRSCWGLQFICTNRELQLGIEMSMGFMIGRAEYDQSWAQQTTSWIVVVAGREDEDRREKDEKANEGKGQREKGGMPCLKC